MGPQADKPDSFWISDAELRAIPAREISSGEDLVLHPVVSVLMLAFNHGEFIGQAIERVVSQQCDVEFELLVGEDCSDDRTRDICKEWQRRHPRIVRLVTADTNVGMHPNLFRLWCRARGQYIALCDGDDYWTDDGKLAKQVKFLNARPEFSMCGAITRRIQRDKDGTWKPAGEVRPPWTKERYGIEDLIPHYCFQTSSVMIRKAGLRFPRWMPTVYCGDRPLYLLCAECGPVGFLPECMSIYRLHESGVWHGERQQAKARKSAKLFEAVDAHFRRKYRRLIRQALGRITWGYATNALLEGDRRAALRLACSGLVQAFPQLPARPANVVKVFLKAVVSKDSATS